jgi:hypothetical protein
MNDAWLKIRIPRNELEGLKKAAEKQGKAFSEYVRELLSEQEIVDTVILDGAYGKNDRVPDMSGGGEVRAPKGRKSTARKSGLPLVGEGDRIAEEGQPTCAHGRAKGYHCWQCGGLANV